MAVVEILKGRWRGCRRVRKCDCKMLVRETTVFMLRALVQMPSYIPTEIGVDFKCVINYYGPDVAYVRDIDYNQLCIWAKTLLSQIGLLRIPRRETDESVL